MSSTTVALLAILLSTLSLVVIVATSQIQGMNGGYPAPPGAGEKAQLCADYDAPPVLYSVNMDTGVGVRHGTSSPEAWAVDQAGDLHFEPATDTLYGVGYSVGPCH